MKESKKIVLIFGLVAALAVGCNASSIHKALELFESLPHRLQLSASDGR